MFTGLVQAVGRVIDLSPSDAGARLVIDAAGWSHRPSPGESISVSGCCLTLAAPPSESRLAFDIAPETLRRTTLGDLESGSRINLERAARADTLLGGHIVQGHIDGVGVVRSVVDEGNERRLEVEPPPELMELLPPKGSVCIDGVSLTIAVTGEDSFEVALIPTTLRETTLDDLKPAARCNLETDILARTIAHWLRRQRG